ncbi:hypothetical protein [Allobranchiibius huperziae]|uniref:MFS family permease n=1 Tax=Allobranchiibius huperziae TaxID=1874116 RepID=A0A853DKL3_9MICO|nr:hypothetical protein [Allobranchiibius huperziae]NYJ76479.1 MFS family permease [Allobranchiibius huperziae]
MTAKAPDEEAAIQRARDLLQNDSRTRTRVPGRRLIITGGALMITGVLAGLVCTLIPAAPTWLGVGFVLGGIVPGLLCIVAALTLAAEARGGRW